MNKIDIINKLDPRAKDFDIITLTKLQAMLQFSKGAKIITLITCTDPDLKRTDNNLIENPYYEQVLKVSRVNGVVNWDYESAVNKQLIKEGKEPTFEAQPRKWGTHLPNSPFISHITKEGEHKLYLQMMVKKSLGHFYYNVNLGEEIPEEKIKPFLKPRKEETLIVRDYWTKNIATIVIDGEGYLIRENVLS